MVKQDVQLKQIEKDWILYVSRKFNWFVEHTQILANSQKELEKAFGFDCSLRNYIIVSGDEYYTDEEIKRYDGIFAKEYEKDPKLFDKQIARINEISQVIIDYTKNLKQTVWAELSNKELADKVKEFQEIYTLSFLAGWSRPDGFLESEVKSRLKTELLLSDKIIGEIFPKLAAYPDLGKLTYLEEPLDLLNIAKQIKDNNLDIDNLPYEVIDRLKEHVKEYSWLKGPVLIEKLEFSLQEYVQRIEEMLTKDIDLEIEIIKKARKESVQVFSETIKEHKPNDALKKLIGTLRHFIYLRTYTTEISDYLFYTARLTILNECAQRLGLKDDEIVMLQSDEIILSLKNQSNFNDIIRDRKLGFAILWLDGAVETIFGEKAILLKKRLDEKVIPVNPKTAEIKGTVASMGKVIGTEKVLLSHLDVDKIEKGDILVTSMTTPDYIAAMEKAAAFVTDEGGITCHAAIVAREFGVPCIVGTQNATKIIKDNDQILVDTNNGVVKLL